LWFVSAAALSLFIGVAPFLPAFAAEQQGRYAYAEGEGAGVVTAGIAATGKGEYSREPAGWEVRPCCRITDQDLPPDDGTTMEETLHRLSVETALRTVDDALSTQVSILTGGGLPDTRKLLKLRDELRDAKNDLAVRRRALAAQSRKGRGPLMRSLKDADRVVRADLSLQKKLLTDPTARDRTRLLKSLQLVRTHHERALENYRRMVAGVVSEAR